MTTAVKGRGVDGFALEAGIRGGAGEIVVWRWVASTRNWATKERRDMVKCDGATFLVSLQASQDIVNVDR